MVRAVGRNGHFVHFTGLTGDSYGYSNCTTRTIPATAISNSRTRMAMVVAGRNDAFRFVGSEDTRVRNPQKSETPLAGASLEKVGDRRPSSLGAGWEAYL